MSTRLVILGLLRERPLYGYEIKSIIEDHMGDWTNIAFGSIYFALGKLADEGYIEKAATEKEGGRPSRSVYRITDEGQGEFERLLREVWNTIDRQYYPFDIGLFFMSVLSKQEIITSLRSRVDQLEAVLQYLDQHQSESMAQDQVPPLANAIFDHTRVHTGAELSWTRDLLESVEAGEYP